MKRKLITPLLAIIISVNMGACKNNDVEDNANDTTTTNTTTTNTTAGTTITDEYFISNESEAEEMAAALLYADLINSCDAEGDSIGISSFEYIKKYGDNGIFPERYGFDCKGYFTSKGHTDNFGHTTKTGERVSFHAEIYVYEKEDDGTYKYGFTKIYNQDTNLTI